MNESFAPLIGKKLHTLILGTMPGQTSLQTQQYYAHPRNALWPILCALIEDTPPSYAAHTSRSYQQRCSLITQHGFGLWDVLQSCEREGSLDSKIVRSSEVPNRIAHLVKKHTELRTIVCNGKTAETLFKRHIAATFCAAYVSVVCLPSTSPAMASLDLNAKHQRWRDALLAH